MILICNLIGLIFTFWYFSISLNMIKVKGFIFPKCQKEKNSKSPWRNEPQTFAFHTCMFYYWPTETLQWAWWLLLFSYYKHSFRLILNHNIQARMRDRGGGGGPPHSKQWPMNLSQCQLSSQTGGYPSLRSVKWKLLVPPWWEASPILQLFQVE